MDTKTALVLIDVQLAFQDPSWGPRNNPQAEDNIATLLRTWRELGRPLFHIQHVSSVTHSLFHPNSPGFRFMEQALPLSQEAIIQKKVNSAFIHTDLENQLCETRSESVVFVGLTTDHCVSTTVRMAGNLGFRAYIVSDATATFDRRDWQGKHYPAELVHSAALVSLHKEFADVVSTRAVLELPKR